MPEEGDCVIEIAAGAAPARAREPVTCGIPWPPGALAAESDLELSEEGGERVPAQRRVLDRWPDGSVRWLLLDWQASGGDRAVRYRARAVPGAAPSEHPSRIRVTKGADDIAIDTGGAVFRLRRGGRFPFESAEVGGRPALDPARTSFDLVDAAGRACTARLGAVEIEEPGPLRAVVRFRCAPAGSGDGTALELFGRIHFFSGSATVRIALTLRNPRAAHHPGGLWDLGDEGSITLKDASIAFALPPSNGPARARCSPEPGSPLEPAPGDVEIYQDSSGGEHWQSTNHLTRDRVVKRSFRGYRLRAAGAERSGARAAPIVALERGEQTLAVALRDFWQNFPKAIETKGDVLTARLFPGQSAEVHELQGGEQKTHELFLALGPDPVTAMPLAWTRSPLLPHADPHWYCAALAAPYLTPRAGDPNERYLRLVDAAIEGEASFDAKRERIDEYGWRHFGDIYGDHEAIREEGLVSHYNNQYDPVAGFGYQFLRSGDPRWWRHMDELARHVVDIDIYHTTRDKSAYNNGLFWHTCHYIDADTATHRSYPRAAKVCGGGPSSEHNYTSGLMLHHFLTGDIESREAAIGLARWVIDMDDGRKTVFRWLSRGPTGLASASASPLYHGPGRGSGNSLNALLDGHRLTRDPAYLAKAEELVRRCIHPRDEIRGRNLPDTERRWFYTIFLQALGKYLDYKARLGALDQRYAYARESLLHYARWMADNEFPYLDRPEILQHPTETWAAQDMRKSEIFHFAAKHADGAERTRFRERAEFFFRYSTETLSGMKTRTLARPVVLLLSYGFAHAYFQAHPEESGPRPPDGPPRDLGEPEVFVPQKVVAKRRFVAAAGIGFVALVALAVALFAYFGR